MHGAQNDDAARNTQTLRGRYISPTDQAMKSHRFEFPAIAIILTIIAQSTHGKSKIFKRKKCSVNLKCGADLVFFLPSKCISEKHACHVVKKTNVHGAVLSCNIDVFSLLLSLLI
uniref:Uncharacterized protein n=1 Tax=Glossina pallidipes TaxID=7398 RepID=A0A1B0ADZ0_GLOPL